MYLKARPDLALHPGSFLWSKEPGNVRMEGGGAKLFISATSLFMWFALGIPHFEKLFYTPIWKGFFNKQNKETNKKKHDFWKATSACFKTIGEAAENISYA